MANPNKTKGTQWESDIRDFLNRELGLLSVHGTFADVWSPLNIRRPAQEGAADVGDIHAVPFILEAKNTKSSAVPTFLRQARVEARNAGFPFGVVVCKVPRQATRRGKVHFAVATWTSVRRLLGMTSRDFADAYGFATSTRGLDTAKWYFTHDLGDFARLLDAVRVSHGERSIA